MYEKERSRFLDICKGRIKRHSCACRSRKKTSETLLFPSSPSPCPASAQGMGGAGIFSSRMYPFGWGVCSGLTTGYSHIMDSPAEIFDAVETPGVSTVK